MNKKQFRSSLLLLLTAVIWGVAFVAQSAGMEHVGPFTFNATRSIIGGLVLLPVIFVMDRKKSGEEKAAEKANGRILLLGGICCGVALAVASAFQQIGIQYTTVGKAGFITAMYIVIVPLLGMFFKKKVRLLVWIAVAIAVAGMYLLCMNESFSVGAGDLLVMICALCFAVHILVIDHFSPKVDGIIMSCIQFFVAGLVSAVPALLFEQPSFPQILAAWMPILYAGAMSSGVGYTLQVVAQKNVNPTLASLIMSLESVVSVLAGWLLLNQQLSSKELLGCALVFCAIVLAQLPEKKSETVSA